MSLENLNDLFEQELKDIYNGESQIIKALPKLARAAQDADLRAAFEDHLEETKVHKQRIEQIFDMLGLPAKGKTCEGMKGIIEEGDEVLDEAGESVMDAALIGAAQRVEHYEIASYGCARTYARALGHEEAADLLQETLDEEKAADVKLTELAMTCANRTAKAADDDEPEEVGTKAKTASKPPARAARRRDRAEATR